VLANKGARPRVLEEDADDRRRHEHHERRQDTDNQAGRERLDDGQARILLAKLIEQRVG